MKENVKKIVIALVLTALCTLTIFAGEGDGTTHSGGKTCPNGQQTCLVNAPQETETKSVFIEIFDYLKNLLG